MERKDEYLACDYWLEFEADSPDASVGSVKDIDDLIFAGEFVKLYSER